MGGSEGGSTVLRTPVDWLWRHSLGQPFDYLHGLFSVAGSDCNSSQAKIHSPRSRENLHQLFGFYGCAQELSRYQNRYELADRRPRQCVADNFKRRVCLAVGVDRIFS